MEVQTRQDDADGRVEGFAGGDGGVVLWFHEPVVGGIGAAEVRDGFGVEFGFDAGFAEDEDGFAGGGEGEDAGDVDGGAVGRAEDFVLCCSPWNESLFSGVGWMDMGRWKKGGGATGYE